MGVISFSLVRCYSPPTLTLPRQRLCRTTVHGSRASPLTVLPDRKFKYLSVRPESVEGEQLIAPQSLEDERIKAERNEPVGLPKFLSVKVFHNA
jgi:hypothetical protein